jgi:hypothetical protein
MFDPWRLRREREGDEKEEHYEKGSTHETSCHRVRVQLLGRAMVYRYLS